MISNWSYSPETPNLGQIRRFLEPGDLEIWRMTLKNNRAPFLFYFKLYTSFRNHWCIETWVAVRKHPIWVKFDDFLSRVTLKFEGWPWKTIGHLFYANTSFVHHFVAIGEYKLELQSGNAQARSNSTIFRAVWPWNLTDDLEKNNRAPLLCCFQLCAWFHCHMWIQTGVRVRKRLSWVLTSVTLTFDLWPVPFAWTSLLTMEKILKISWWYDDGNMVKKVLQMDRQMDGRTDRLNQSYSCLVAAKN